MRRLVLGLALALAACRGGSRALPPAPAHWVTDEARVMSADVRTELDARLVAYQARTQHTVMVYVVESSRGESHFDYAFRLFNGWTVGRKGVGDGLILFVFTEETPHCWISTGWGFVDKIPDAEASRICRDIVSPAVRGHDVDSAVRAGLDAILADIGE